MGGAIAEAYGALLEDMWSGKCNCVAPRQFKVCLCVSYWYICVLVSGMFVCSVSGMFVCLFLVCLRVSYQYAYVFSVDMCVDMC